MDARVVERRHDGTSVPQVGDRGTRVGNTEEGVDARGDLSLERTIRERDGRRWYARRSGGTSNRTGDLQAARSGRNAGERIRPRTGTTTVTAVGIVAAWTDARSASETRNFIVERDG